MFGERSPYWKKDRKLQLCKKIVEETKIPFVPYMSPFRLDDVRVGKKPYVTMDCFEDGVYIRKTTHLEKSELERLDNQCCDIYKEIMFDEGETI